MCYGTGKRNKRKRVMKRQRSITSGPSPEKSLTERRQGVHTHTHIIMQLGMKCVYGSGLVFILLCVATQIHTTTAAQNRCDKNIPVITKTECMSCTISTITSCPAGYSKKTSGKGKQDCRYYIKALGVSFAGCSHECYKEVLEEGCCPGYWGNDCIECPGSAAAPCNNNGVCSDGLGGNGTCTCKAGFMGTACEKCEENLYGPTCSNICSCKHGLCNSGLKGSGQCTCFSGYTGLECDQELPGCTALRCGPDALCSEDISGKLTCKCKPGYLGDGVQCTSINPCLRRGVCHQFAVCTHMGPGQHTCSCVDGYQGDGVVCMAVDPCQRDFGGCNSNSTQCVYDSPGKAHCECLPGFEGLVLGLGCSLKEACKPNSCHKYATCTTVAPGTVECNCQDGFLGNGKICFGNIMRRLQDLNSEPGSRWTGQLTSAIRFYETIMSWPLTSQGPFTLFVPNNKAFKSSVQTLLADEANARYLVKMHMVAGEVNFEALQKGILYYTLTGKPAESISEMTQVKVRLHGSRRKGTLLESDIIASNGIIHIIDKMMDTVPSTVISDNKENLMKILSDNSKFSQLKSLIEKTNLVNVLEDAGPYTLFAPTNTAFSLLKDGYLDYLSSDDGNAKLLELLRNHIVPKAELKATYIASSTRAESMANQVLAFNVTSVGQFLVSGVTVIEADVEAKNGRLYSLDGVLIPPSIEPVLPHRCDVKENRVYMSHCYSCALISKSTCPTGVSVKTFYRNCATLSNRFGKNIPSLGCSMLCNETRETPQCCKGFFGPECSPCPGGFTAPCSSHGKCFDGIDGNGTCQCDPRFKGSRCQYCADPNKYGPSCNQTCGCVQGVCDNRPEAHGVCKPGSCKQGFAGQLCDKHMYPCGPHQPCHAHANCVLGDRGLTCVCKPGFQGNGFMCVEMDPCASPPNGGCSINAKCVKTGLGVRRCECMMGWKEDGDDCQPVNNCVEPSRGGCHPNATCIHLGPGQNYCVCKKYFLGNGRECEPINQCVVQMGGCHQQATCVSGGPEGYKCKCLAGYSGDGTVCYGNLAQEVENNPELSEFSTWITTAGLTQMLSENQNMTLFLPSTKAISNMSKEENDFWRSRGNLQSLIKNHMVSGLYSLADLRIFTTPQLVSLLKKELPVSWTNETTRVGGAEIISGDMVAKNGIIHLIDTVLLPDHKLSEGLLEVLNQRMEYSLFRSALIKYNLTEEIENSSGYTVFAPTDTAVTEYLKSTGEDLMDVNVTQYHIILGESLAQTDLQDGLYKDTMLGFSYQLAVFNRDSKWFVNKAAVSATDIRSANGVIHGLSAVLKIPNNRCDSSFRTIVQGSCVDCFYPTESHCPPDRKEIKLLRERCTYRRKNHGWFIGCKASCQKVSIVRKCCTGFYGLNCEDCPGPQGQPCFGNGVCSDGINGTGVCQCNPGFSGAACESCQTGKYGIHCDQDCKCVHGRCNEGQQGDGTCDCDVGWRGILCSTAITSDSCGGKCHTSANCLLKVQDNSYYCSCAAGYQGNGTYCTAIDACAVDNGGCSSDAVCKRTLPGRRQCVCKPGYAGNGTVCVSINPCLDGNHGCGENSDCIHTGPNKTACVCKPGYTGNGRTCSPINLCQKNNGGCFKTALCTSTGPGERNCTCRESSVGDGFTCKETVLREIQHRQLNDYYGLQWSQALYLKGRGPYTVFVPNNKAYHKATLSFKNRTSSAVLMYHIVSCQSLLAEDLRQPQNLTTLSGEILTISYSKDTIYINNNAKVVYSDLESTNGIFHEIDTVLIPPRFAKLNEKDSSKMLSLQDVVEQNGFKTFYKLLEDTDVIKDIQDPLHQPVTLFLPTDDTMTALPQEQKDFLYGLHNRAQLLEYLQYHILRDKRLPTTSLVHSNSLNTLQGSGISVSCVGEENIGALYVNDKSCRIVKRDLNFKEGVVYGIDCLLTPPSLGGRCDQKNTVDITLPCVRCNRFITCPDFTKKKTQQKCDLPMFHLTKNTGCQAICSLVIWKPKCCSGYYGRDCLACPGGPKSPCSNHGKCDEDQLGNGTCSCDTGFQGVACELCTEGHFGPDCKACNCTEHGSCDEGPHGTGSCFCDEGWTGPRCEHKLANGSVCLPACHEKAVCYENNTCMCRPFYEGDGITCTVANLCKFWNGGCSKNAKCSQKKEKVICTCLKGYSGDGHVCTSVDSCVAEDNGGCHEHAICTMTGPGKRKCACKENYVGDGLLCELKVLPLDRCMQDNGLCHSDAQCTDLHYQDKTVGVFHYRSPLGVYKLNYSEAQEACIQEGGVIANYTQLSYAQQAGYSMCAAGWLAQKQVAYPMSYSRPNCGFGHVGIVDYGIQTNLSKTWDTFCYRMQDVKCECKAGYIGDGYSCTGNLLQVMISTPNLSNFLAQIWNYSRDSAAGQEFLKRLSNITIQSTLFAPDNDGLYENETLSYRDLEHHLLDGRAMELQTLLNITHVQTRLGKTLTVKGIPSLENPQNMASSGYVNDRFILESDVLASNGVIHILQGPLKAPPLPPTPLHQAHKAGMGIGLLLLIVFIAAGAFVAYHFYNQQTKPFQFHYFKDDEKEDMSTTEPTPYVSNPMYEATIPTSTPQPPTEEKEDRHQVVAGGCYDLLQVS